MTHHAAPIKRQSVNGMKRLSNAVIILGALAGSMLPGCGKEAPPEKDVLTKKEMAAIVLEAYLMREKITDLNLRSDSARSLSKAFERVAMTNRKIADSVWQKSFTYYLSRPKEMDDIISQVIDTLSLRSQRLDTASLSEDAKND